MILLKAKLINARCSHGVNAKGMQKCFCIANSHVNSCLILVMSYDVSHVKQAVKGLGGSGSEIL